MQYLKYADNGRREIFRRPLSAVWAHVGIKVDVQGVFLGKKRIFDLHNVRIWTIVFHCIGDFPFISVL